MTRSRLMLCSLLCVAFLVPACGGGGEKKDEAKKDDAKKDEANKDEVKKEEANKDEPAPENEQDEPAATANASLTLGAAKLYEPDQKDKAIIIGEDGSITAEGEEGGGSVTADGKLLGKDGKVFAELKSDGKVTLMGQKTTLTIDDKGVASANDKRMSIGEDGKFVTDPADDKLKLESEGCTGEMARTCMFVMMGMLMPGRPVDSAGPVEVPAAQ